MHRPIRTGLHPYLTNLIALTLVMGGGQALAGNIQIDFNADFSPNASVGSGQYFSSPNSHVLPLSGDGTSLSIALGFNVSIGGTMYSSIFVNENGIVTFGSGLASGSFSPAANFAALDAQIATPFIAASYANLQTVNGLGVFDFGGGTARGVLYQTGVADPLGGTGDPNGHVPGAAASLPPAFSIVWSDASQGGGFMSQLALYSLDNSTGAFALRLRYGSPAFGSNALIGAIAGYSLGSLSSSFAEPFNNNFDYFARFDGAATRVPEPNAMLLLIAGLAALFGLRQITSWKRRRSLLPLQAVQP